MTKSTKLTETPTETPKQVTETPTEAPKPEVTETPKPEVKQVTETPKLEVKSPEKITETPLVLKPKRKQSPKQLENLSKGRGKPKIGGSKKVVTEKTLEAPTTANKTMLYLGLTIGVIAGSIGIYKLYQMFSKPKPNVIKPIINETSPSDGLIDPKEAERLEKIKKALEKNFS